MSLSVQGLANPYASTMSGSNSLQPASSPFANLDLTSDQQTAIQSILQSGRSNGQTFAQMQSQIQSVLTPTQQQTLQNDLQNVKSWDITTITMAVVAGPRRRPTFCRQALTV